MANRGGAVPICDAYKSRTDSPTGWGGCCRSTKASSTRLTSDVGTRLARSSATSRISSRSLGTRWPVLAERYRNGMNRRNGARSSSSRWPRAAVFVSFSSIRSHLFTATMIAAPRHLDLPGLAPGVRTQVRGAESLHDAVQQVPRALADRGGHGERISQAELVEREVPCVVGQLVGLVGDQDHRAAGFPQVPGDLQIRGLHPRLDVDAERHHIV